MESIIHGRQKEYCAAINASNDAGESTAFIEFMLSAIKVSLTDAIKTSDGKMGKTALRWRKIEEFLKTHDYIMNVDARELCDVAAAMANRTLAGLVTARKLKKCRQGGHWTYRIDISNNI